MKNLTILLALVAAVVIGVLAGHRFWPAGETPGPVPGEREVLYWVAPMDPNYRRPGPGKSPMGMDLVPVYADDTQTDGVVTIAPHVVNNLGVRTAPVAQGDLTRQVDVPGYVRVDEDTVHHVHTRVEGWIERMTVKSQGERVSRGQTLFELYSPALVGAQEEYLTAVRTGNRSLIRASQARLKSLGVNDARLASLRENGRAVERVPIRAERDGIVDALNVREGMYVQPTTTVMSLYTLETVWLVAELFERDGGWLKTGSAASVRIDSIPDRAWTGAIDYIYPDLDPVSRTLRARLTLTNADEALRPGMFARVSIDGAKLADVLHIAREALIRGGHQDRVVVALGEGRYQSRTVETGLATADRVQIRSGLERGDEVVISGQFLIDSESNVAADLARARGDSR